MLKIHNKITNKRLNLTKSCSCNNCPNCNYSSFCFGCKVSCDAKFCQSTTDIFCNMQDCGIPCKIGANYLLTNISKEKFNETCDLSYNYIDADYLIKTDSNVWNVTLNYLIDIRMIMGKKGFTKRTNIKERLQLSKESKLYLSFCVPDDYLNLFRNIKDRWHIIESFNFNGILAPNYSIYNNDPVCNRMINEYYKRECIKKSANLKINIYPELYLDKEHFNNYVDWIKATNTNVVYVSFQKQGNNTKSVQWKEELNLLEKAINTLNKNLKVIVIGCTSNNRKSDIQEIKNDIIFVDDKLYRTTSHNGNHKENFVQAINARS